MFCGSVEAGLDRPRDLAERPESLELGRDEDSGDGCFVIHAEPPTEALLAGVRATAVSCRLPAPLRSNASGSAAMKGFHRMRCWNAIGAETVER
jgi:hypothetical protein